MVRSLRFSTWPNKLVTNGLARPALFVAILILGTALRFFRIGHQNLWYDESFTAMVSALPLGNMLAAIAGDVHPPLWYLIEALVVRTLGNSEWALRLPSAILGTANLWLAWRCGLALGLPHRVNLLALGLLAVSPFQVYYSQEARMYQLLLFGVLLGLLAVLRWRWWLFSLAGMLLLYTHNLGLLYIPALNLVALVTIFLPGAYRQRKFLSPIALLSLANVAIGVGYLPWVAVLIGQIDDVGGGFWIQRVNFGEVLYALHMLFWSFAVPSWASGHAAFLVVGLTTFALWHAVTRLAVSVDRRALAAVFILFLVPQAVAYVASIVWRPIYLFRALIGVSPALCWLVAYALNSRWRLLGAGMVGLPVLALALGSYYFNPVVQRDDIEQWAQIIRAEAQPGDVVFHANLASYILFSYYLPDVTNVVWRQANDLSQSLTEQTKEAMLMDQVTLDQLRQRGRRAWLIYAANPTTSTHEDRAMQWLLAAFDHRRVATMKSNRMVEAAIYLVELDRGHFQLSQR